MAYSNDELVRKYNNLIIKAKNLYEENRQKRSEEEREYYAEAEEICIELAKRYTGYATQSGDWKERAGKCAALLKKIDAELHPAPVYEPVRTPQTTAPAAPRNPQKPTSAAAQPLRQTESADESVIGERRTLTTTPSGFSTYNARQDVPATMIEGWFKAEPKHDMSDVTGMEDIKNELFQTMDDAQWEKTNEAVHHESEHGILFYGPPGTGKTFIIEAFISELMKKGYNYIQLLGGDISSSLVGVAEKIIETAFQEAVDKAPCVIFIDEIEAVCKERKDPSVKSHEKTLTSSFLQAFNKVVGTGRPVLLLAATNHLKQVEYAMVDRMSTIEVDFPNSAARSEFFEKNLEGIALEDALTYEIMAEKTEGCSYRVLTRLKNDIAAELKKIAKASVGVSEEVSGFGGNPQQYSKALDEAAERNVRTGKVVLTGEIFDRKNKAQP